MNIKPTFIRLVASYRAWKRHAQGLRELEALTDRELRDIGCNQVDVILARKKLSQLRAMCSRTFCVR
ncbi:DUF1127 domain-containing protein [Pseudomonas batumici]|uniref:DUF1127 domain-containing protein n=1 Tax=Pseudomonas batumici TaxID=226910 RepID=UPI0030D28996